MLGAPWPSRPVNLVVTDTNEPSCELWAGGDQSLTVFVVGGTRFYSENYGKFSPTSTA